MANNAEVKTIISEVLNLENTSEWGIVSQNKEENIYMVHHSNDADLYYYGGLRGVVVDTKHKTVISHSYPYSPKVVASSISLDDQGKINLRDENNTSYSLDPKNIRFKTGFEGTLMHVFKHNGNVYRTTRKKLDPSRSRWGNSVKFTQMYWDLGGPTDEVLFSEDAKYSPYCHTFIMVHPDVLVATRDDVGKGYLVYLGPKQMYSTEDDCPFPFEEVDEYLHIPETSNQPAEGIIYQPENLSLEEVNKQLLFGFYDGFEGYEYLDPRLLPGEFVILETLDEYGELDKVLRIESPSYTWRCSMRNNNPNIHHRFYELIDYSYVKNDPNGKETYQNMFPLLTKYSISDLKKTIKDSPIMVWPQTDVTDFPRTKEDKLHNIWQCLLVAVPFHHQAKMVNYITHLTERKNELINWLFNLSYVRADPEQFSRRAKDILVKTRKFATDRIRRGENIDNKTGKIKSVDEITKDNIRNFINKEMGPSLYRLVREMDKIKEEARNKELQTQE